MKIASIRLILSIVVTLLIQFVASCAFATTNYWDNNGATAGFGTAAGTWAAPTTGDGTQGWSTDSTGGTLPVNVTTTTNDVLAFGFLLQGLASGAITVSGTVEANSVNIATNSGAIILSGGTIVFGGINAPQFRVNNGGNIVNSALRLDTNSSVSMGSATALALTLNGQISGSGNLTFTTIAAHLNNADCAISLGAASTYSGNTLINVGNQNNRLRVRNTSGAANALPVTTVLTLDGGTGAGTGLGRNLFYDLNSQSQTLAGLVSIQRTLRNQQIVNTGNGAVTLTINNSSNYIWTGRISGTGISVVKDGTGTQSFTNINAYNGTTTINAGKLRFQVGGDCANSTVILNATTATNSVSITDINKAWTCANLAPAAAGVMEFDFGALVPGTTVAPLNVATNADFTVQPVVTIKGTSLVAGIYPLISSTNFLGTPPATATVPLGFTGTLAVLGTNLNLTLTGSGVTSTIQTKTNNTDNLNLASSWTVGVPTAIDIGQWNDIVTSANTTDLGADLSWAGIKILNPGGLVAINAGNTLTLSGSGVTNIDMSAATADLTLNCGVDLGAANLWSVTNTRTLTVGGVVSGSQSVTKQGDGMLVLTNVNTFTGGLTNEAGTLKLGGTSGNVLPDNKVVTLAGGSLDLADTSDTIGRLLVSGPVTMTSSGSGVGVLTSAYTSTAQGAIGVSADFTLQSGKFSSKYWRNDGITTIAGGTLELPQGGSEVLNGYTTGGAVFTLNSGLVNAQQVSCGNSPSTYNFNGGMVQCGIFKIRGAGAFDFFFNGTTLQPWITAAGTFLPFYSPAYGLSVNYSVQPGQNAWISTNGIIVDTSVTTNGPLTIAIDLQHDAILGVTPDGGFTKIGTGGLILASNCTYTGSTIVSNGTLLVNGTLATSPVTVHAGATLGGIGTMGGLVTVNSGGTLAPGESIGTLTLNGNLVLNTGSTNSFEVDGTTPANDQVALGAAVTYGGVLQIVPTGSFTVGQTFPLFSGAGANNSTNFASVISTGAATFSFTNGVLTVVDAGTPSPATLTNSVSGSVLSLSWPAGEGWRLEGQTNALSVGIGNTWSSVTGSSVSSTNLTIDPNSPTVFYRLAYP